MTYSDILQESLDKGSASLAYRNYQEVREKVLRMLDHPAYRNEAISDYWQEELAGYAYMFDASPLIINALREQCYHITGLKPRSNVGDGPAFIQSKIFDQQCEEGDAGKTGIIGIATGSIQSDILALLRDLEQIIDDIDEVTFLFKFHPLLSIDVMEEKLRALAQGKALRYRIFKGTNIEFFRRTDIVILNQGSMAIEAACLGEKAISYVPLHKVPLSYFDNTGFTRTAWDADSLRSAVLDLMQNTQPWIAHPHFSDYYNRIDDALLAAFESK